MDATTASGTGAPPGPPAAFGPGAAGRSSYAGGHLMYTALPLPPHTLRKSTEYPICGKFMNHLRPHLTGYHQVRNVEETILLVSWSSGRVTGKLNCRVCDKVGLSRLDRHLADLHQQNNMLPLLIHIGNIHDAAEHNGHQ
ncbi:unnamed protein product [Gadus morhua 'NCC']